MTTTGHLTDTSKYARVTFNTPQGRKKFIGMCRIEGDMVKGEAKYDDPKVEDGYILHLLYAHIADVIKIERENPHDETWEVA